MFESIQKIGGHLCPATQTGSATGSVAAAPPSAAPNRDQRSRDTQGRSVPSSAAGSPLPAAPNGGHKPSETHSSRATSGSEGNPLAADLFQIGQPQADRLTETNAEPEPKSDASPSAPFGLPEMEGRQQPTNNTPEPRKTASAAAPIDQPETDGRLTETKQGTRPRDEASPSEPIAANPKAKRRRKATTDRAEPAKEASPSEPIGLASNSEAGDEGQASTETQCTHALVVTVNRIVEMQSMRRFCIKSQSRCDRSIESLIARYLGYHTDLDEKERKALFRRAGELRKQVEKGGDQKNADTHSFSVPSFVFPAISASAKARKIWDDRRLDAEKEMERLAKQLPVWPWAQKVRGLGAKGLAIIVGEAGIPIGDYRTISGLWSRLGMAVIDGVRQQRKAGELGKVHKFSPGRRAEVWAVCSDSLFRAQWRGDRDEDGGKPEETGKPVAIKAHPIGPYGEAYASRRAVTSERMDRTNNLPADDPDKWSKGRCHNDARRVMTKELIKDLWIEWRRATRDASLEIDL